MRKSLYDGQWKGNGKYHITADNVLEWYRQGSIDKLLLIKGNQVKKFRGKSIHGWCKVIGKRTSVHVFFERGLWTKFAIELEDDVSFFAEDVYFYMAMVRHQKNIDGWAHMMKLSIEVAYQIRRFLEPTDRMKRIIWRQFKRRGYEMPEGVDF